MAKAWITKRGKNWVVGWREAGKRHERTQYSKSQADGLAADITHRLNRGLVTSLMKVSWADLLDEYLTAKQAAKLAESSIVEIKGTLSRFERLIGKPSSTEITQKVLDEFKFKRGRQTKSNSTLNKDITNLRAFLRFFSEDRAYIRPNLKLDKVRACIKPVVSLSEDQVTSLLAYLKRKSPSYYIRALLAVAAGLDVSTIDRIQISEIHFDANTIDTMRPKKQAWHMQRPIQSEVMTELSNFLAEAPDGQKRLLPDEYSYFRWKQLTKLAGVNTTFHQLRKTFCSLLQKKGVSLAVAQELLDHASIQTTKKHYTDTTGQHKEAVEALEVRNWIK